MSKNTTALREARLVYHWEPDLIDELKDPFDTLRVSSHKVDVYRAPQTWVTREVKSELPCPFSLEEAFHLVWIYPQFSPYAMPGTVVFPPGKRAFSDDLKKHLLKSLSDFFTNWSTHILLETGYRLIDELSGIRVNLQEDELEVMVLNNDVVFFNREKTDWIACNRKPIAAMTYATKSELARDLHAIARFFDGVLHGIRDPKSHRHIDIRRHSTTKRIELAVAWLQQQNYEALQQGDRDDPPMIPLVSEPLDTEQVAQRQNVTDRTVRIWCRKHKPPCHNAKFVGGRYLIPSKDVPRAEA